MDWLLLGGHLGNNSTGAEQSDRLNNFSGEWHSLQQNSPLGVQ